MRLPRVYLDTKIQPGAKIMLGIEQSTHLLRVLRLRVNDGLIVFDGHGCEYLANITDANKKYATIVIQEPRAPLPESSLFIHLGQSISRGEKMDYCLQKSVELGVQKITPLLTERGGVKLSKDRLENKISHWEKVIISACEQCGRSYLPILMPIQYLSDWLMGRDESMRFVLAPSAEGRLKNIIFQGERIVLLVGSEGGLSKEEINLATQFSFSSVQLGPRILRTETAGPIAIAAMQCFWGDLG